MRITALIILFVSPGASSSSPAPLIPHKLEETLAFLHSLYQADKFSLTAGVDSIKPVLGAKHKLVSGFSEPFTWSQLVELQAASSMALMYLRSIRPLTPSNDQPALDDFVVSWRTVREQMKRVVDETPGTANDLSTDLVKGIHEALIELKDAHSQITELLSKPVDGLNEFTRRNAYRFFETSTEVFEDWSLRRIDYSTVNELQEMCKSAAGDADSLAQSAGLYELPATATLGRELKRIVIRIRLFITQIHPSGSEPVSGTMPMGPVGGGAEQLAISISGKMGQTMMIINKLETQSKAEASLREHVLRVLHTEKQKLQQSSLPDDLFEICSTVVSLLRLYQRSVPGYRVSWMKVLVPEWDQLRLAAVQLLRDEVVADVAEGVRTDFRSLMSEIRPVLAAMIASGCPIGDRSRGFLVLAAVAVDDLSMRSIMLTRAAIFDNHVKTVVDLLGELNRDCSGALAQQLKGLIARLRTISRHTRKTLKRRSLQMTTAVTTESSQSSESSTASSLEPDDVPLLTTHEPTTSVSPQLDSLNAASELDPGEWLKSRHDVRRDMKKLRHTSDRDARPTSPVNIRKRHETTGDEHIDTNEQHGEGMQTLLKARMTGHSPKTYHAVIPMTRKPTETSKKTTERPSTASQATSLRTEQSTERHSTTQQIETSTKTTDRPSTASQAASLRTEETTERHSTTQKSVSVTTAVSLGTVDKAIERVSKDSSVVETSTELNLRDDEFDESTDRMDDGSRDYAIQHILAPQPVTHIGARIRMLADTIGYIASEISVLATDASGSSLDEATSFNIGILCEQLTSTRMAIDQFRMMATGFEEFANQLPPVAYPVVCFPFPPAPEEE